MPAANDDSINQGPDIAVALHARYLLALKGHHRGAFLSGLFYGAMVASMCWYFTPRFMSVLGYL